MRIRDVDLNVQITGSGVPLLWGHGLMSSMEAESDFDWLQWHMLPQNIRLVRYDARGHGKSQISLTPEDYHWQNLGKDMLALADAVGETQFIAAGASMGCATAIYAALQAPERIKALILVIPPTIWETRATQGRLYQRTAMLGGMLGGDKLAILMGRNLARSMPGWMVESVPGVLERAARKLRAMPRQALWHLFRGAALCDLPPREALYAIADIPTSILAWAGDATHPVSSAQELHRLLPNSELFIAEGYDDFARLPQHLRRFVARFTEEKPHHDAS